MSITLKSSANGLELSVGIEGRFDFAIHQVFRNAYENVLVTPERYVIDLQAVSYIDSSALGMLLLLRDHAGGDQANIILRNAPPEVLKVLEMAHFERLFQLA